MLVARQALPLSGQPAEPEPQVLRLNALAARRFARLDNLTSGMALATSGSGTPLPCAMVELLVGGNFCEGAPSYLAEKAKSFAAAALPEEQAKLVERTIEFCTSGRRSGARSAPCPAIQFGHKSAGGSPRLARRISVRRAMRNGDRPQSVPLLEPRQRKTLATVTDGITNEYAPMIHGRRFDAIARDTTSNENSPYHSTFPYVISPTLIRRQSARGKK